MSALRPTRPPRVYRLIQVAFQQPLVFMRNAGLRADFLSPKVMPAGKHFFDHNYKENYVQLYHEQTRIVHNNWIKGHNDKKERFRRHHLWLVENMQFPGCGNPDLDRSTSESVESMAGSGVWTAIWAKGVGVSTVIVVVWYFSAYLHVFGRHGPNV